MPLVIDHIIPRAMGGSSDLTNLAASCYRCNEFKGARMDAVDPLTKEQVSLQIMHNIDVQKKDLNITTAQDYIEKILKQLLKDYQNTKLEREKNFTMGRNPRI